MEHWASVEEIWEVKRADRQTHDPRGRRELKVRLDHMPAEIMSPTINNAPLVRSKKTIADVAGAKLVGVANRLRKHSPASPHSLGS